MMPQNLRALWAKDRAALLVIGAIFAMVALNQLGSGLVATLVPVYLAREGYPASAVGAISTVFSMCFLVGCVVGPQVVSQLGPRRTLIAIGTVHGILCILRWLLPGPLSWAVLRGVSGLITATYFVLLESWLGAQTSSDTRGIVFGCYMVVIRLAFGTGQLLVAMVAPSAMLLLFLLAGVAYAVTPWIQPRRSDAVPPMRRPSLSAIFEVPRKAPAAAAAVVANGCLFGTVQSLLPKWGVEAGVSVTTIAWALVAVQFGGLIMQLPISYASDRYERRTIMILCVVGMALATFAVQQIGPEATGALTLAMFVWGGFTSSIYTLGTAHANDLAPANERVAWVSSLMFIWGIGAMVGPIVAALMMDGLGVATLWIYATIVSAGVGVYLVWRKLVRP